MTRYARLPMYDFPEVRAATEGFWAALAKSLRRRGVDAPDRLEADGDHLVLGQVCGIEVATQTDFPHRIVGAPVYDFPGCEGANHRAFLIVRADDDRSLDELRGSRAAVNEWGSNSGANLFGATVGEPLENYFKSVTLTTAHRKSMEAIQRGAADLASIDCVTYGLLEREAPEATRGLRILQETIPVPAPPFVSDLEPEPLETLRACLSDVLANSAEARVLGLRGLQSRASSDYDVIRHLRDNRG